MGFIKINLISFFTKAHYDTIVFVFTPYFFFSSSGSSLFTKQKARTVENERK